MFSRHSSWKNYCKGLRLAQFLLDEETFAQVKAATLQCKNYFYWIVWQFFHIYKLFYLRTYSGFMCILIMTEQIENSRSNAWFIRATLHRYSLPSRLHHFPQTWCTVNWGVMTPPPPKRLPAGSREMFAYHFPQVCYTVNWGVMSDGA